MQHFALPVELLKQKTHLRPLPPLTPKEASAAIPNNQQNASNAIPSNYASNNYYVGSMVSSKANDYFVNPNERLISSIGNGFFTNLLFGNAKSCSAMLTDKRVYFRGTIYQSQGKAIKKTTEERTIDVEDITASGFIYTRLSILSIVLGVLLMVIALVLYFNLPPRYYDRFVREFCLCSLCFAFGLILLLCTIIISRKTWFYIEYAGGRIQLDARIIGLSDVQDFNKQIRRVKDAVLKK